MRHDVIVRVPKQNGRGYELITVEVDGITGDECAAAAFAAVPRAIAVLTVTPSAPRVISARVLDPQTENVAPTAKAAIEAADDAKIRAAAAMRGKAA